MPKMRPMRPMRLMRPGRYVWQRLAGRILLTTFPALTYGWKIRPTHMREVRQPAQGPSRLKQMPVLMLKTRFFRVFVLSAFVIQLRERKCSKNLCSPRGFSLIATQRTLGAFAPLRELRLKRPPRDVSVPAMMLNTQKNWKIPARVLRHAA